MTIYIDYLNKDDNHRPAREEFTSFEEAETWMKENIAMHNWNTDIIKTIDEGEQFEEHMLQMEYKCTECGYEWNMAHTSNCNDRCPECRAETEPYKTIDT